MAITVLSTGKRQVVGDRFMRRFNINEVPTAGDEVDLQPYGVHTIEDVVGAVCIESAQAVQARKNSITDSITEDDPGRLFLATTTATDDVVVTLIYR